MDLGTWLDDLRRRGDAAAFPARVRVACEAALAGAVAARGLDAEWRGDGPEDTAAAALGLAIAERARGGAVAALVRGGPESVAAVAIAALAPRFGAELTLVVAGDADAALACAGALGVRTLAVDDDGARWLPPERREWPPVRLRSLRTLAAREPEALLAAAAAAEPRLLLPHAVAPWAGLTPSPTLLIALGALAGEGRRVAWRLPAGTDLAAWWPALRAIGRRGLAMTLLVDAEDLPPPAWWRALPAWWVAAPADAAEAAAVTVRALASEDAIAIALPPSQAPVPAWPADDAHEPGAGRWLAADPAAVATIVCTGASAAEALRARDALAALPLVVAVHACTSLRPLPEADLAAAAARGPLVVAEPWPAEAGLAAAIAAALPGARVVAVEAPGAADLAAAVREAVGA